MSWSTLSIKWDSPDTDVEPSIDISLLRGEDGYSLNGWRPSIAQLKRGGIWQSSPMVDGRQLAHAQLNNTVETFSLIAHSDAGEDELILFTQELKRAFQKALSYWTADYQTVPVYLEAQAACETNARKAIIKSWSSPDEDNPFDQPFMNPDGSAMLNIILNIERGHWQSTPPATSECQEISSLGIGNESQSFSPTAGTDDAYVVLNIGLIRTGETVCYAGEDLSSNTLHSGIRFRNVTVANGATIVKATIRFTSAQSRAGAVWNFQLNNDNNVPFSSYQFHRNAYSSQRILTCTVLSHQINYERRRNTCRLLPCKLIYTRHDPCVHAPRC